MNDFFFYNSTDMTKFMKGYVKKKIRLGASTENNSSGCKIERKKGPTLFVKQNETYILYFEQKKTFYFFKYKNKGLDRGDFTPAVFCRTSFKT